MRVYEERFTFGKYEDVPLKDVPDGYLKWFVENFDNPDYELLCAVEAEQKRRKREAAEKAEADAIARQTPEGRARLTAEALQHFYNDGPVQRVERLSQFRTKR